MVFHWSLSDSKSPQVSWTRLSILAVLSSAVVWIVSTHPPTSKSSRPFNNPLVIVPNAPEIRWSVCMLKPHRSLCVSFSRTSAGLCIYHLFVWSNWNFLHISQGITLPTQSCLALYSFCANLLHSLIIWLIVSSLSPHSLHLLFCCVLSILALIWLVLVALSCAAIWRDSVSLLKFPFLSQV